MDKEKKIHEFDILSYNSKVEICKTILNNAIKLGNKDAGDILVGFDTLGFVSNDLLLLIYTDYLVSLEDRNNKKNEKEQKNMTNLRKKIEEIIEKEKVERQKEDPDKLLESIDLL